jgi:hypothetical protein
LNIGDSYTSGGRTWRAPDKKNPIRAMNVRPPTLDELKPKDLIGVPWRPAFALQSAGWYLQADIVWNKPNCQPESVKDRPTRCHEYLFLFSKNEQYYYDSAAVRGPNGRNVRTVWNANTRPYTGAHFATFPSALVEPCIDIASERRELVLDPFIGSGTTGVVALQKGRRFVGIDLNPGYVDIAEQRLHGTARRGHRSQDSRPVAADHIPEASSPLDERGSTVTPFTKRSAQSTQRNSGTNSRSMFHETSTGCLPRQGEDGVRFQGAVIEVVGIPERP